MKITRKQIRSLVKEALLTEQRGKGIMHIIKRNGGKRLPKSHRLAPSRYQFADDRIASNVVWEINSETGRQAANSGNIVTVYT
jgi:hypothetical protein